MITGFLKKSRKNRKFFARRPNYLLFARCRGRWPLRVGAVGSRPRPSQRRRGGRSRADPVWGRVDLCADAAAAHSHGAAGEKLSPVAVDPRSAGAAAQFGPFPVAKAASAFWGGGGVLCRPEGVCQLSAAALEGRTLPAKGPPGRPLLGRNGHPLLPGLRKREGLRPRERVSCGRARPPPPLPGEKGPFCRQMAHGRSTALPEGRGRPQHPFFACSQRPSRSIRAEMGAALTGCSPLPGGEKGGPSGRGFLAGACAGKARPLPPGGSASKGGTVALALGVKNWYPEGRYRARCWRAGTEKGGVGQWSGSTFTWKICGSTT